MILLRSSYTNVYALILTFSAITEDAGKSWDFRDRARLAFNEVISPVQPPIKNSLFHDVQSLRKWFSLTPNSPLLNANQDPPSPSVGKCDRLAEVPLSVWAFPRFVFSPFFLSSSPLLLCIERHAWYGVPLWQQGICQWNAPFYCKCGRVAKGNWVLCAPAHRSLSKCSFWFFSSS